MSWHITFNNLADYPDGPALPHLTQVQIEYIESRHREYLSDLDLAYRTAKALGLSSVSLSGFRTPSPYGDDEVVEISVRGMTKHRDFNAEMKHIIEAGPDAES